MSYRTIDASRLHIFAQHYSSYRETTWSRRRIAQSYRATVYEVMYFGKTGGSKGTLPGPDAQTRSLTYFSLTWKFVQMSVLHIAELTVCNWERGCVTYARMTQSRSQVNHAISLVQHQKLLSPWRQTFINWCQIEVFWVRKWRYQNTSSRSSCSLDARPSAQLSYIDSSDR